MSHDPVNHPSHYTRGGIETIEIIKAKLSPEEWFGYLKGSIFKYTSRAGHKGSEIEDLRKAEWYLKRLIEEKSTHSDSTQLSAEDLYLTPTGFGSRKPTPKRESDG